MFENQNIQHWVMNILLIHISLIFLSFFVCLCWILVEKSWKCFIFFMNIQEEQMNYHQFDHYLISEFDNEKWIFSNVCHWNWIRQSLNWTAEDVLILHCNYFDFLFILFWLCYMKLWMKLKYLKIRTFQHAHSKMK